MDAKAAQPLADVVRIIRDAKDAASVRTAIIDLGYLKDPEAYPLLVAKLDDPSLMVRRYAYKTLCDITRPNATDRLRYRADALPERRREGLTWWQGQLERGLIHR